MSCLSVLNNCPQGTLLVRFPLITHNQDGSWLACEWHNPSSIHWIFSSYKCITISYSTIHVYTICMHYILCALSIHQVDRYSVLIHSDNILTLRTHCISSMASYLFPKPGVQLHNFHTRYWTSLLHNLITCRESSAHFLQLMPWTILHSTRYPSLLDGQRLT